MFFQKMYLKEKNMNLKMRIFKIKSVRQLHVFIII